MLLLLLKLLVNIDIEYTYVDVMKRKKSRQFMLLTLKSFIGQFVNPIGWEDWSKSGIVTLARCELHFIREHKNLK